MKYGQFVMQVFLLTIVAGLSLTYSQTLNAPTSLTVEVNDTAEVDCEIQQNDDDRAMYTAEDITWYNQNQAIPREMYSTISNTTSVLVLPSMQFADAGDYACRLDSGAVSTIQIQVGTVPKIANFSCQARNMKEVWCTWDPVPSNLPTTYVFTYKLSHRKKWKDCPDLVSKGPNSCYIEQSLGTLHNMRVVATNDLGTKVRLFDIDPDIQSKPDPPEDVKVTLEISNNVAVSWNIPSEWYSPHFTLVYKLQYYSEWKPHNRSEELDAHTQLSYTLTSLDTYTCYTIHVATKSLSSRNEYWSDWSTPSIVCTKEPATLGAAEITNIYTTSRSISLRWQPPHALYYRSSGNQIRMPDYYTILYNITYCIPSEPSLCVGVNIGSAEFVILSDKMFPWTTYEITLQGNFLHLGYGDLVRVNVTTNEEAPVKGATLSEDWRFHDCDYSPDKRNISISWEYVAEKKYWRGELQRCEIKFWYQETHCDATVIERTVNYTSVVLDDISRWKSLHIDVYTCNNAGCKAGANPIGIDAVKVARDAPRNILAFETSSTSFNVTWVRPDNNECIKSYNVRYTSEFYKDETEVTDQYAHITNVPSGTEYTVSLSANIYKGYNITEESEPRLTTVRLPDNQRTTIIVTAISVALIILCLCTLFYCHKHRILIYEHCFKSIRKKDFSEHMDGLLNDRPSVPSYDESFLYDTLNNTSISTSTHDVNASVSVASVTESSLSTTTKCKTDNFAHSPASTMTRASQNVSLLLLEDILISPPTPDDNSGSTDIEQREEYFLGRISDNVRSSNDSPNGVNTYATLRLLSASRNDVVVDTQQVSTF